MKSKKQITLADIAKKLDVSKVTVSKALRNHSDISEKTKIKVRELVKEMGYTPNILARSLSAKKTHTIGLVIPKINHHFFAEAIESIYSTAQARNYEIIMTVSQENTEHEKKHIRSLMAMRVDGILISVTETTKDKQIFKELKNKQKPLVFFDRVLEGVGYHCIVSDDEKGSYEIVKYAIEQGSRRIAHLGGYENTSIGQGRCNGYLKALTKMGIQPDSNLIIRGGFSVSDGYNGFMKLYKTGNLPELIFAVTFPVALGIYKAAEEVGLKIPTDIDVVSFGGSSYNQFLNPSITSIHQPAMEIGKMAVELLIDQIEEKLPIEEKRIVMPVNISIGQTCIKKEKK